MPYKRIQPIPDLEKLKHLSKMSALEYKTIKNGPYLVGEIISKKQFSARHAYDNNEFLGVEYLPHAAYPKVKQQIIKEICQLDKELGFYGMHPIICVDQTQSRRGLPQRHYSSTWHCDQQILDNHNCIARAYLVADNTGTLFLKESETEKLESAVYRELYNYSTPLYLNERLDRMLRSSRSLPDCMFTAEDYKIYLLTSYTWHRSRVQPPNTPRTFMRLLFPEEVIYGNHNGAG